MLSAKAHKKWGTNHGRVVRRRFGVKLLMKFSCDFVPLGRRSCLRAPEIAKKSFSSDIRNHVDSNFKQEALPYATAAIYQIR
jgi:hypothetical protein